MRLDDPLSEFSRILPTQAKALKKLGIHTVRDLLYYFPTRYGDTSTVVNIADIKGGGTYVVFGRLTGLRTKKAYRKKMPFSEARLEDDTGKIKVVWFHQAYMAKILEEGLVRIDGKVAERNGEYYFSNPKIEPVTHVSSSNPGSLFGSPKDDHHLYPIYPETRSISSNWLYHKIEQVFSSGVLDEAEDPIPSDMLERYHLPDLKTALVWIHTPKKRSHAEAARKRFAFEEIFFIQLERQATRRESSKHRAFAIEKKIEDVEPFIERFPFQATRAQRESISHILRDFRQPHPMARLLEGDVGSGKTAVAATAAYAITTSRPQGQDFGTLQTAYLAPTEILAKQHFESFITYFKHMPVNVALITGSGCRKFPSKVDPLKSTEISKSQLLKWVSGGEISILIGTHALVEKSVKFKHLAFVIIDEQHRFGTTQRQKLAEKDAAYPHLLSMTATPIPRTLSLTLYGDLDLSLLDEMPQGRKRITTELVSPAKREDAYQKVRTELSKGRQVYVICPRIEEPDPEKDSAIQAKSVKTEAKRLKKEVFPDYEIGILHSKMPPSEKESVMIKFKNKEIDILVATSMVEVGVNVENASVIIIEGAERFGLAQLHQLRGRVVRGTHEPYCFIFTDSSSEKTLSRLKALQTARNGFELAEFDLAQRGGGTLSGLKQWGVSDVAMEALQNIKMVEAARQEAVQLIEKDPSLMNYSVIKNRLASDKSKIHFE